MNQAQTDHDKAEANPQGLPVASLAGVQAPALLQTSALCAHLGVNSSTIWRWIRDPKRKFPKPAVQIGSRVRMWKTVEVDAWLNSQTSTGAAQ